MYAAYPNHSSPHSTLTLLTITPLLDSWHNMGAESHYNKFKYIIEDVYHRKLEDVLFVTSIVSFLLFTECIIFR